MLEQDIRDTYQRMAAAPMPPSPISIPARRAGSTRRGRRRAGLISAPVFAATAVLAIALTSAAITGNGRAPALTASPRAAPAHFSPLRPYVALSPADRAVAAQSFLLPAYQVFSMRSPTRELGVFAAGQCTPSAGTLTCPRAIGEVMLKPSQPTGHLAGKVDGHRAYWSADVGSLSISVTFNQNGQETSSKPGAGYGVLQWQYARGGWAELAAPSERAALSTARATRVGPAVAAPVRFPVQLVEVPARWKVKSVAETANKWHDTQWTVSAASAPVLTSGLAGSSCAADIGPGRSRLARRVVNGYHVQTMRQRLANGKYVQELCAPDADGIYVILSAFSSPQSLVSFFAHHLRLLGSDPVKWTTKPTG